MEMCFAYKERKDLDTPRSITIEIELATSEDGESGWLERLMKEHPNLIDD